MSLEACLKEKLLQSMMRMKPLIWSSGFSIRTSRESRMALRMSVKEFLRKSEKTVSKWLCVWVCVFAGGTCSGPSWKQRESGSFCLVGLGSPTHLENHPSEPA